MRLVLLGLIVLGTSLVFFYLTDFVSAKIENTEMKYYYITWYWIADIDS